MEQRIQDAGKSETKKDAPSSPIVVARSNSSIASNTASPSSSDMSKLDPILDKFEPYQLKDLIKKMVTIVGLENFKAMAREVLLKKTPPNDQSSSSQGSATYQTQESASSPRVIRSNKDSSNYEDNSGLPFLRELKVAIASQMNLRHVDLASEIEKRKKEKVLSKAQLIMEEIKGHSLQTSRKALLDMSVVEGKQYWKKDMDRFFEEAHKVFLLDFKMMKLVFDILELYDEISITEAKNYLKNGNSITDKDLAMNLLQIGFSIKLHTYSNNGNDQITTAYASIIRPSHLPAEV